MPGRRPPSDAGISISDNGPGIAPETVASLLDYNTRTSSREAYVSPTSGAQGNALKTILAMGFARELAARQATSASFDRTLARAESLAPDLEWCVLANAVMARELGIGVLPSPV